MLKFHRWIAVFAMVFGLYFAVTGSAIQMLDLRALLSDAPGSDPTIQAINVGVNGPPNFQVFSDSDIGSPALPANFDYAAALKTLVAARDKDLMGKDASFVEWRVLAGNTVGIIHSGDLLYRFDATTGSQTGTPDKFELTPLSRKSFRNEVKDVHRLRWYGPWIMVINLFAAIALMAMVITGLAHYWRLYRARTRTGRTSPMWSGGGLWRSLHRATALLSGLFLLIICISGIFLTGSSLGVNLDLAAKGTKRPGLTIDVSSPLKNEELPAMLATTLSSYRASQGGTPIQVLRLRYFAGMPQGVIVAGGRYPEQFAFNAATGETARLSGANYPDTNMPWGWHWTQIAKRIHRGDYIGLTGRWVSLLSGFSLLYLSSSGIVLFAGMWRKRRRAGRKGLFW